MVASRIWFTAHQKAELWERWKSGQSVLAISRALERRNKTGVQRIVALNGGIAPARRRRAVAALRLEEREDISRGIAAGRSMRQIAQGLGRSPSTVSREIRRNGGCQAYRANRADRGVPGSGRYAPSLVAWRCIGSYDGAWRGSSRFNGRRSRSPAG
jgi:DNA-binding CsgD family transcriptional regulator